MSLSLAPNQVNTIALDISTDLKLTKQGPKMTHWQASFGLGAAYVADIAIVHVRKCLF